MVEIRPVYPHYKWLPEVLANVSSSAVYLAGKLNAYIIQGDPRLRGYAIELVENGLGITDATSDEIQLLIDQPQVSVYTFADMVSRRAQIGWSTHGHSAVDVNIYGSIGTESLHGNHENTDVGKFLREYLDLDVQAITEELLDKSLNFDVISDSQNSWTGRTPNDIDVNSASSHQFHDEAL